MSVGTDKWFSPERGYGMILLDEGKVWVSVRMDMVDSADLSMSANQQRDDFDLKQDRSGVSSVRNIRLINGETTGSNSLAFPVTERRERPSPVMRGRIGRIPRASVVDSVLGIIGTMPKTRILASAVAAVVILLVALPVESADGFRNRQNRESKPVDLAAVTKWVGNAAEVLRINSDPVLRTVVCRVAYNPFTAPRLVSATGLPASQVNRAFKELRDMGLVRFEEAQGRYPTITSANPSAREKMRRLAERYCSSDRECGVKR